ncbi:hypothetical protein VNO80_26548 [Phaseolus coccineus]|uniref:Uncharacterized protein n=1 Tax=Phaseolus coccineus TaxID=3886 RepID=A0AAN9LF68_PHACN
MSIRSIFSVIGNGQPGRLVVLDLHSCIFGEVGDDRFSNSDAGKLDSEVGKLEGALGLDFYSLVMIMKNLHCLLHILFFLVSMPQQAKAYMSTSNPIFDSEATIFYLRRQKMEENTVVVVVSLSYTIELLTLPWFKKGII